MNLWDIISKYSSKLDEALRRGYTKESMHLTLEDLLADLLKLVEFGEEDVSETVVKSLAKNFVAKTDGDVLYWLEEGRNQPVSPRNEVIYRKGTQTEVPLSCLNEFLSQVAEGL